MTVLGGTYSCPACGGMVVVSLSRDTEVILAYDPVPGTGEHHDVVLTDDRMYAAGTSHSGFAAYQPHGWSCPARLHVPPGRPVPPWGGYWA
jgi:hypothetical protein